MFIFGAETWVVTPHIGRDLGVFQDQVPRPLTERLPHQCLDIMWYYTSEEAGFEMM